MHTSLIHSFFVLLLFLMSALALSSAADTMSATCSKTGGLLRIIVSNRPSHVSFSKRLGEIFTDKWKESYPSVPIVDRVTGNIPHLDYESQEAGRKPLEKHTPETTGAFKLANDLTDELLAARHLLIVTPMFNWGPPSSLKAWIDRVINVRTFVKGGSNVLSGLPITIIVANGGAYSVDAPQSRPDLDFLRPALLNWFTQMGAQRENIHFIDCDPTGPIDAGMVPLESENSGWTRALAKVPAAAARIKAETAVV